MCPVCPVEARRPGGLNPNAQAGYGSAGIPYRASSLARPARAVVNALTERTQLAPIPP